MSNFVLTKQHLREVSVFCFNWKGSATEPHRMQAEVCRDDAIDFPRMAILALKTSLPPSSQIRRLKLGGFTPGRSHSNARGACKVIGSDSTKSFCANEINGKVSKSKNLGGLSTETERHLSTCK